MTTSPAATRARREDRYQGFRLDSVCWGYREIFERAIEELFASGMIGAERPEVTAKFFEMMRGAERTGFDRVLKDFLTALGPRVRWILGVPEIFADVVDTGRSLAGVKHYYGSVFFETLRRGGFGGTPRHVRELITLVRRLREVSDQLALALVKGYARLLERLSPAGIRQYVQWGVEVHARNAATGLRFMEGLLRSSEDYVKHIGRTCVLNDVRSSLARLLRALVGYGVGVQDLGALDSDDLLELGSHSVCLYRWLYLPASCSRFDDAARNRSWYTLAGVCAAALLAAGSFPRIHGHRDYRSCADLVGNGRAQTNLFAILEYARAMEYVRANWPGAAGLLARGWDAEFDSQPPAGLPGRILREVVTRGGEKTSASRDILRAAGECRTVFAAGAMVRGSWGARLRADCPGLGAAALRAVSFLPDFRYSAEADSPPPDSLVLDLKQDARRERADDESHDEDRERSDRRSGEARRDGRALEESESADTEVRTGYVYDEWSHLDRDYYRNYCLVHESRPDGRPDVLPAGIGREVRRVRRAFELLKPDAPSREKRLPEGDAIDDQRLQDFMVRRRREPSPRVDFYERPRIARRDIATLILLDVSGSTGATAPAEGKVIDSEKQAAIVLAEALASLGDRFSVCGFSGQGREDCRYWVYKDFDERWGKTPLDRVLAARPATATRIGAALRHSGYRLSKVEAHQRLVLLVTDGKPLDAAYDPNTRYAQYDVRKACQENRQRGISTICISTEEDSRADMGIMFPQQRFAILKRVEDLPRRMAELYIKVTR